MSYLVEILVKYKKGLLDPEAKTIQSALAQMGYDVSELKTGKYFSYTSNKKSKEDARKQAEELSNKLLTNPLIENFNIISIKEYNSEKNNES